MSELGLFLELRQAYADLAAEKARADRAERAHVGEFERADAFETLLAECETKLAKQWDALVAERRSADEMTAALEPFAKFWPDKEPWGDAAKYDVVHSRRWNEERNRCLGDVAGIDLRNAARVLAAHRARRSEPDASGDALGAPAGKTEGRDG